MKSLNKKIDRFCWNHPRFGIPKLMTFVVIGQIIVYLFCQMDRSQTLAYYLYFNPALFCRGQVWRLLTFQAAWAASLSWQITRAAKRPPVSTRPVSASSASWGA